MTNIYAWPPFKTQSVSFSVLRPSRSGVGAFTGERFGSTVGPSRLAASVSVSALAGDRDGAGMAESLLELMAGRVHLARMNTLPVNWIRDSRAAPFSLTGPANAGTVTTSGGFDAIQLTGQVPGAIVCRAFDVVGSYSGGTLQSTARAVRTVRANVSGVAVIPLHSALPAGIIWVGAPESRVWAMDGHSGGAQGVGADWSYSFALREVLTAEIPAGATEVDPWS